MVFSCRFVWVNPVVFWPGDDETAGGLPEDGEEAGNAWHYVLRGLHALRQAAHPVRGLVLLHLQGGLNQGRELTRGEDTVQWRLRKINIYSQFLFLKNL